MRAEIDNAMHTAQQTPRIAPTPDPMPSVQGDENQSVHLPVENSRNSFAISKSSQINRYRIDGPAPRAHHRCPAAPRSEPVAIDRHACQSKKRLKPMPINKTAKIDRHTFRWCATNRKEAAID